MFFHFGITRYYSSNNIGSTTLLTDKSGNDIGQFLYTPFGEMWVDEASTVDISHITRFFTNQQYDKESGLYYYNARYYDPHLGSFITPDPKMAQINHYAYCGGNPIKYTDPTGLDYNQDTGVYENEKEEDDEEEEEEVYKKDSLEIYYENKNKDNGGNKDEIPKKDPNDKIDVQFDPNGKEGIGSYTLAKHKQFGTQKTINKIEELRKNWHSKHSDTTIKIGHISYKDGGPLHKNGNVDPTHVTHQNGVEVDIKIYKIDKNGKEIDVTRIYKGNVSKKVKNTNLDSKLMVEFAQALVDIGAVKVYYNLKAVYDKHGETVKKLDGHYTHFHVKFFNY